MKYKNLASSLSRIEIRNGAKASFWFDEWSPLGRIIDITGLPGTIDLGINVNSTVEHAVQRYRRRRHRTSTLLAIENEILRLQLQGLSQEEDIRLWKGEGNVFRPTFSSYQTWHLTRTQFPKVDWYKGLWFPGTTPKYFVMTWITIHNRLATGDMISKWSPTSDA